MTHANVLQAPPADIEREPTKDERSEQIDAVLKKLDMKYHNGKPIAPKRTLLNLDRIVKLDPWFLRRLRYNGLSEVVEWERRRMRDEDLTRIRLSIARTYGVEFGADSMQAVLTETAQQRTFHPVLRYLKGLLWDQKPRIDCFLSTHLGVVDSPLTRAISRRWFISCVARAAGKGEAPVKVDTVLILKGAQGAQKSTCFKILAGADWFSDTQLDLRSKDAYQAIRGVWIYELAELAATRPRDAETGKAFLSAQTDRYRPPYGRNVVESHRQCVFVGTTNEETFLADPTGARRFWPVTVGDRLDLEAVRRDRDMLWAEAAEAYRKGETWWLSRDEDLALAEAQEQYQHEDPWTVAVREWLTTQPSGGGVVVSEILEKAIEMDTDKWGKHHEMRIGGILTSLGYDRKRVRMGNGARVWRWVKKE